MQQSIGIVADYLDALTVSLINNEPFSCQQQIAIEAERRMFSKLGTNTHKGYFFLAGMLLIGCWQTDSLEEVLLRPKLCELAENFFRRIKIDKTNGQNVREKFNVQGIVAEALKGFPSLFEVALPAFQKHYQSSNDYEQSAFYIMAKLMQCVEDTTTLYRGGVVGLQQIKRDGLELEKILIKKEDHFVFLKKQNLLYIDKNLTMGGVADLLGLALGYLHAKEVLR